METLNTALKERILNTINDQLCRIENEDQPSKERIELVSRLLPYVIAKKSAFKEFPEEKPGEYVDPLEGVI